MYVHIKEEIFIETCNFHIFLENTLGRLYGTKSIEKKKRNVGYFRLFNVNFSFVSYKPFIASFFILLSLYHLPLVCRKNFARILKQNIPTKKSVYICLLGPIKWKGFLPQMLAGWVLYSFRLNMVVGKSRRTRNKLVSKLEPSVTQLETN